MAYTIVIFYYITVYQISKFLYKWYLAYLEKSEIIEFGK
jgi:hypothetical protein